VTVEEQLINFVTSARYEDLPQEAVEGMKCLIMNSIAAILAGAGAR
jgi:2-methylcitrate dehydratase PrpD